MNATGSQIPLDQLVSGLDLLLSALAALIGFVILWFTVFKGADIDLVPVQVSIESPDIYPDFHLDTIVLRPIEMVFVNSGSRAGAVVEINATFNPSKSFNRFYKGLTQHIEIKSPVIIPDRGTAVVTVALTIKLRPWKDLSRLIALTNLPLGNALKVIWIEGREALVELSKFKDNLGTLDLRVRRTRRHRLRIQVREDVITSGLNLEELPEWVRVRSQTLLNNFSKLREDDAKIVGDIRRIPDLFMSDYRQNVSILSPGNIGEMKQLQTSGFDKVYAWERWERNPMQYVLAHEGEFKEQMQAFYQQVTQYNDRIRAIAPGSPFSDPERRALEAMGEELRKKNLDFHDELQKFAKKLAAETAHLVISQSSTVD